MLETRGPFSFGPWTVNVLVEWEGAAMPCAALFPGIPESEVRMAAPSGRQSRLTPDGQLVMSTQLFLARRPGLVCLIEMGTGNDKVRPAEPHWSNLRLPYLETLAALDVKPEDVVYVFFSHLHADHVGLATTLSDGRWIPTFPRAKHVINRAEWDYWSGLKPGDPARHPCLDDSVAPLVSAGVVRWTAPGEVIAGVRIHDAAGHTPGNVLLELENESVWFSGDLFHHPAQVSRPDWPSGAFDHDQEANTRCRLRYFQKFAETKATIFGVHLGNSLKIEATAAGGFFPKRD